MNNNTQICIVFIIFVSLFMHLYFVAMKLTLNDPNDT